MEWVHQVCCGRTELGRVVGDGPCPAPSQFASGSLEAAGLVNQVS